MIKDTIKAVLSFLKIDLTKNLKYDRLTKKIFEQTLTGNSNCIDIGCHKGEVLDEILKLSPTGNHIGFEPIPDFNKNLSNKYSNHSNITISNIALSDAAGEIEFNYVKNAPAYSGIKQRKYATSNPDVEKIKVTTQKLDAFLQDINYKYPIHLMKVDVEGAEMMVFKGAVETIRKHKPIIIFEFGLGASDYYNTTPDELYNMVHNTFNMKLSTLDGFLKKRPDLTSDLFKTLYVNNQEYYFIIHT